MARRFIEADGPDDDAPDWDDDDADDESPDDDEEPTVACPHCRREIHEDSQRCPYCEKYISQEDAPSAAQPFWIVIGAVICLYVVFRWIMG
jgi:hypothetical protein